MINMKKWMAKVSDAIKSLKNSGPIIYDYSANYNIGASASIYVDVPITIPTNYKFGLAVLTSTGKAGVLARDVLYQTGGGTHIRAYVDNIKTTAQSDCTLQVRVMYMPITWGGA